MSKTTLPARSRALPSTLEELESQRRVKRQISLFEEVEQAYLALFEDSKFRRYRGEEDPDITVEGNQFIDDVKAAEMIRDKATELGLQQAAKANLDDVLKSLRRAERNAGASRKQRAAATPIADAAE